jgi:hypothetical protein
MEHLYDESIINALTKQDPVLAIIFPSCFNHVDKSPFALMLDALLEQIFTVSTADEFRDRVYDKLGVNFGPIDLLLYLQHDFWYGSKIIKTMCVVCKDTLNLDNYTNTEMTTLAINNLVEVPGIAPWTIRLMRIYTLSDLDIFPTNDRNLRHQIQKIYKLTYVPGAKECSEISEKWAPYRSVVTWHLWMYRQ